MGAVAFPQAAKAANSALALVKYLGVLCGIMCITNASLSYEIGLAG